jgi:hypothetical protein
VGRAGINGENRHLQRHQKDRCEEGVLVGDGLTILSTHTIEEARQVMEEEPLIKRGLRNFELRKWELREGRIDISLRASVSRYWLSRRSFLRERRRLRLLGYEDKMPSWRKRADSEQPLRWQSCWPVSRVLSR